MQYSYQLLCLHGLQLRQASTFCLRKSHAQDSTLWAESRLHSRMLQYDLKEAPIHSWRIPARLHSYLCTMGICLQAQTLSWIRLQLVSFLGKSAALDAKQLSKYAHYFSKILLAEVLNTPSGLLNLLSSFQENSKWLQIVLSLMSGLILS